MNKLLDYFKQNQEKIFEKKIHAYGWKSEYDTIITSSLTKYLFEDLDIIENIAPRTNENRDGRIRDKYYITVHDTGDAFSNHTAKFWSEAVKSEGWEYGKYECSFQYVTGNDGIFHNIPDDEIAYHAGDTTMYDYALYDSGVSGDNKYPHISISLDGYFEIDGRKSKILAPRAKKVKDGVVLYDKIATSDMINSQGILCKLIDGKYYLGETYFNTTYELIANRGGNNNGIGIESCINEGSDIYLTWQRTAKLVAYLLDVNKLDFDAVKQHHYFSGKNCPQTIRMSNMWDHFMELVKFEYQIRQFRKQGYSLKLICEDDRVCANGRVKKLSDKPYKFKIESEFKGKIESIEIEI